MTDLVRLRELEKAATPGPWWVEKYPHGQAACIDCENVKIGGPAKVFDVRGWGYLTGKGHGALGLDAATGAAQQLATAELVAALRNAAPALLTAAEGNERMRARIEKLEKALRDARSALDETQAFFSGILPCEEVSDGYHAWADRISKQIAAVDCSALSQDDQ